MNDVGSAPKAAVLAARRLSDLVAERMRTGLREAGLEGHRIAGREPGQTTNRSPNELRREAEESHSDSLGHLREAQARAVATGLIAANEVLPAWPTADPVELNVWRRVVAIDGRWNGRSLAFFSADQALRTNTADQYGRIFPGAHQPPTEADRSAWLSGRVETSDLLRVDEILKLHGDGGGSAVPQSVREAWTEAHRDGFLEGCRMVDDLLAPDSLPKKGLRGRLTAAHRRWFPPTTEDLRDKLVAAQAEQAPPPEQQVHEIFMSFLSARRVAEDTAQAATIGRQCWEEVLGSDEGKALLDDVADASGTEDGTDALIAKVHALGDEYYRRPELWPSRSRSSEGLAQEL